MIRGAPAPMAEPPPVIFCHDSPKRVLVSVIRTTPATPPCSSGSSSGGGGVGEPEQPPPLVPTSPGFSDFMVYPWRWGENAHNVTLSPGAAAGGVVSAGLPAAAELPTLRGAPPSTASVTAASGGEDEEEASSPDSGHLKVSGAGGRAAGARGSLGPLTVKLGRGAGPGKRSGAAGAVADRTLTSLPRAKTGPLGAGRSRDGRGAKAGLRAAGAAG